MQRALEDKLSVTLNGLPDTGPVDSTASRVAALGSEAAKVADALARLAATLAPPRPPVSRASLGEPVRAARMLVQLRRSRDGVFGRALFADPAWDMLLHLFVAQADGRQVDAPGLGIAAGLPPATAARWIAELTERELLMRNVCRDDNRRTFVALTPRACCAMADMLSTTACADDFDA